MSIEDTLSMLQSYGLTRTQAQIFIYLTRMGASSISSLAKALKTNRMNIHRNLKRMQDMGLINIIPGRPLRFLATPANIALDILLSTAKNRVSEMESKYPQILDALSKISSQQQEHAIETKFRLHNGRRSVYAIIMQILEESKREVCILTTPNDLVCLSLYGLDDALKKLYAKMIRIRILTNISDKKTALMLRDYMKYATIRHTDIQVRARFIIVDNEAAFTSLTVDSSANLDSESDSGFWTDSPHYIQSIKTFFEIAWRSAQDASIILQHLKTGKPVEKTIAFNDLKEYYEYLNGMLNRAESYILICVRYLKEPYVTRDFIQILKNAGMHGTKIKILTNLDEAAESVIEILEAAEVRHIDMEHIGISFITTDTGESLLCFPPSTISERVFQMQCLWSNFIGLSTILSEMFMDLWSRALSPPLKLAEIRFKRAVRELSEKLKPTIGETGWLIEMPAVIKGGSGLNQKFDLALKAKTSLEDLIVGDFLLEMGKAKVALISLHVKAIDAKATRKLLIIPRNEWLSSEERELAAAYNIELVEGIEAEEISQNIMEKISGAM
ncbi:MAG: helix-turn-helix domain-containing protein [Candidatus Bathyarchaeia archaeon]